MAVCRGCGRPIVWGVTADGGRIPLDPRPPVYIVMDWRQDASGAVDCRVQRSGTMKSIEAGTAITPASTVGGVIKVEACSGIVALVSHFATCPKASEFGAGRKREKEGS